MERAYYMKKGTITAIVLAVISLIALGLLALFLSFQFYDDLVSSGDTKAGIEADAAIAALYETETEAVTEQAGDSNQNTPEHSDMFLIWAGDSRTIGMKNALANDNIYIGESGEGYEWLSKTGLPQIKDAIAKHPTTPVILNFGVNDYDNLDRYLTLYQKLVADYPKTPFYFLSVNPIEPTMCDAISNEEIRDFNQHLKETFPDSYLDSFTYLMINQVMPVDGVHYSEEDYGLIFDYVVQQLER